MTPKRKKNQTKILTHLITGSCLSLLASNVLSAEYIIMFNENSMVDIANSSSKTPQKAMNTGETLAQAANRIMSDVIWNQLITDISSGRIFQQKNKMDRVYNKSIHGFTANLTPEAIEFLQQDPTIKHIVENSRVTTTTTYQSTVRSGTDINGLDRIDQTNLPLNGEYSYTFDGSNAHIYIIDSGTRTSHTEFSGRIGNGFDFVDNDSNPTDCDGHGTGTASVAAGSSFGPAKNSIIHPVRVLNCSGSGSTSDVIDGIDWVIDNYNPNFPTVANISIGTVDADGIGTINTAFDQAVRRLVTAGVFTSVSAGNDNRDACSQSPAREPSLATAPGSPGMLISMSTRS